MKIGLSIRTGLVGLAFWASLGFGQDGRPALVAIRYAPQASGSRLTLQFTGVVRYGMTRTDHRLILGFSGTTLATARDVRALRFQNGLVRSVTSGQAGADSIVVTVVLRDQTTSTLTRPSGESALYIDVTGDPDAPAMTAKPGVTAPVAVPKREETRQQPGPVDIPALARAQFEEGRKSREPAPVTPSTASSGPERISSSGTSQPITDINAFAVAILLSVGGTLTILAFLRRRAAGKSPASRTLPVEIPPPMPPASVPPVTFLRREETVPEVIEPMFEESAQMAKVFQRGKEEVNLAMNLRARTAPRANRRRLAEVVEKDGSNAQRRTAARRLGVGVGEVELALHLKSMENRTKQKEGEQ